MAESTLTYKYWEALDDVSDFLGHGTAHTDADNLARVRDVVEKGYRMFLVPPPLPRYGGHRWSFLSPRAELTLRTQKESGDASGVLVTKTLTDSNAEFLAYGVEAGDTIQMSLDGGTTNEAEVIASVTSDTVLVLEDAPAGGDDTYTYYVDDQAWQYPLPDDFGALVGEPNVEGSGWYAPIPIRGEGVIRRLRARGDVAGRPQVMAVRPRSFSREVGQRWELLVWPDPDSDHTVLYRYDVLPSKWGYVRTTGAAGTIATKKLTLTGETFQTDGVISGDKVILSSVTSSTAAGIYVVDSVTDETNLELLTAPGDGTATYEILPATLYPYGGFQHTATLTACCLAQAELWRDDAKGVRYEDALERLAASIEAEQRMEPKTLGYNGDPGRGSLSVKRSRYVEYEGTIYGDYAP